MSLKFSQIPTSTQPAQADFLVGVTSGGVDQKVPIANIIQALYPVGSLYFNATNSANPATLIGFGTWQLFSQGQMLVGVNSSDSDFSSPGNTGGEKQHTLSWDEMPVHNHGIYDPGHSHSTANGQQVAIAASSTNRLTQSGSSQPITWGNTGTSTNGSNIGTYNAGSGWGHNNMPPYITVYIWQRTA